MAQPDTVSPAAGEESTGHSRPETKEGTSRAGWMERLLPPVLLVLAGLVAYSGSFGGEFILDDVVAIKTNATIRRLQPLGAVLFPSRDLIEKGNTVEGRPLLNLSFALNYAAGGLEVRGYHVVNLAIHLVAGLLLYGVVRRTLWLAGFREGARSGPHQASVRSPREVPARSTSSTIWTVTAQSLCGPPATWLALLAALLWVLHPLQTESVTYLSQRAESLVGLFYLLTMYLAIRSFAIARTGWWRAGAVAACVMGMGVKEVMATAPLLVLLFDRMFVAESWRELWRSRGGFHAALMISGWGVMAALMLGTSGSNLDNLKALALQLGGDQKALWLGHEIHWKDYAWVQPWALVRYLRLSIWPSPLVFTYGPELDRPWWQVVPCTIVLGMLLAGTIVAWRRRNWMGYAGAWFFLILAPTSSVIPLSGQTVAEHRMYLPLAGVIVLGVVGGYLGWLTFLQPRLAGEGRSDRPGFARWPLACPLVLLLLFGGMTMARNRDYATSQSIWADTAAKWPTNGAAFSNLGTAFFQAGKLDEALEQYRKAVEAQPDYAEAHVNLAHSLLKKGRVEEALEHCQRAIRLRPDLAIAHNNLGTALLQSGRTDEAIAAFRSAIKADPKYVDAQNNLGAALRHKGLLDEAIAQYRGILEIRPDFAEAHFNLGNALVQKQELDEAILHYRSALQFSPNYPGAHGNLADALVKAARPREAVREYEGALKTNPKDLGPLNNFALLLATSEDAAVRDGFRAIELGRQAVELSGGKNAIVWHTMMVAQAADGQMAEAIQSAEKAVSLALAQGNAELADAIRKERDQYQARVTSDRAP